MSRNNDYTTGNLLHYDYFSKHYKLIAIDLSKQAELEKSDLRQQISFEKIERNKGETIFFINKNQKKQILIFRKILEPLYKMETQKIVNLLTDSSNYLSKFETKKWYIIDSESKGNYAKENPIKF